MVLSNWLINCTWIAVCQDSKFSSPELEDFELNINTHNTTTLNCTSTYYSGKTETHMYIHILVFVGNNLNQLTLNQLNSRKKSARN